MECSKIKELLSADIDNCTDQQEKTIIAEHLNECLACKEYKEQLLTVKKGIKELASLRTNDDFFSKLTSRLEKEINNTKKSIIIPMWKKITGIASGIAAVGIMSFLLNTGTPILQNSYIMAGTEDTINEKNSIDSLHNIDYNNPEFDMQRVSDE